MNKYDEKTNLKGKNCNSCGEVENCVAGADGADGTNRMNGAGCVGGTDRKATSEREPGEAVTQHGMCEACEARSACDMHDTHNPHDAYELGKQSRALELTVTEIIRKLRIPARVRGYSYIRTAVMLSVERPELLHKVTTALYPTIAEEYSTTASRVERAIRHAIEVAWENGGYSAMCTYFGYELESEYDKPSNSELIALVCDEIRVGGARRAQSEIMV